MKKAIVALARRLAVMLTASGLTAPNSGGPEKLQQREDRAGSNA
jgi:hypothetical protein